MKCKLIETIYSFSRAFLVIVLLSCLALVCTANLGVVQASTDVTGIISSDITWTKANSPYSLTGNILVDNAVTLTIEAGTTVNLNGFYIMVNGTLQAQGTSTAKVNFNIGEITFISYSIDWNEQTGSGCIIENANLVSMYVEIGSVVVKISKSNIDAEISGSGKAIICDNIINGKVSGKVITNNTITGEVDGITVSNNIITGTVSGKAISNNTITGGVDVSGGSSSSDFPVVSNNTITGDVGISCTGYALIVANKISGCETGIRLHGEIFFMGESNPSPLIEKNLITDNTYGITIAMSSRFEPGTSAPTIRNNTIISNSVGIHIYITNYDGRPTISYNNIHDNTDYNIELDEYTKYNIDVAYNWWGTNDTTAINQTIYDFNNDFNLGKVNFVPILSEPNPEELSTPIPEFPSLIVLPFVILATFVLVFCKRKLLPQSEV